MLWIIIWQAFSSSVDIFPSLERAACSPRKPLYGFLISALYAFHSPHKDMNFSESKGYTKSLDVLSLFLSLSFTLFLFLYLFLSGGFLCATLPSTPVGSSHLTDWYPITCFSIIGAIPAQTNCAFLLKFVGFSLKSALELIALYTES